MPFNCLSGQKLSLFIYFDHIPNSSPLKKLCLHTIQLNSIFQNTVFHLSFLADYLLEVILLQFTLKYGRMTTISLSTDDQIEIIVHKNSPKLLNDY